MPESRVLVAGAGPVGLVAALVTARAGVPVTVLEKRPALGVASRASTFHPPTLEILDALGVLDEVLARGHRVDRIQYHEVSEEGPALVAEFDLGRLAGDTRFPFRLHLEQSLLTPVLLARLLACPGAEVVFEATVAGWRQGAEGVEVTVDRPHGRERRSGAYLVGADGAASAVREGMATAFEGSAYAHRVVRVMVALDLTRVVPGLASISYLFRGTESVSLLRMPECWRVVFRVPAAMSDEEALDPARVQAELRRFLPRERLPERGLPVVATDIYAVSQRVAAAYREGRVVLAGDAAHLTNTRGGMNMNCGIHDAWVLGQALAGAWRGDEGELTVYAETRRRVARDEVIPRTDRTVTTGDDWLARVRALAADPAGVRGFLRSASMLDVAPRVGSVACSR